MKFFLFLIFCFFLFSDSVSAEIHLRSAPGCEINILGNATSIVDGDATPSLADHTDFGSQSVCSGTVTRTFTIENTGIADLVITTVDITGTNAADFSVTVSPASPVLAAGFTTFEITFNPSASGIRSATITVNNDDADESAYDFSIEGTGVDPEMNVVGNSVSIVDGDAVPSGADHTGFGGHSVCTGNFSRTYTIQNTGTATLNISSVTITGTHAADFSVTTAPSATVAASTTTTLVVTFNPSATGVRSATINITNDDCNETVYDYAIQGNGMEPEINVTGNGISIADGDAIPDLSDNTDFGSQVVCSGTVVRTYSIQNTGNSNLIISSVNITGVDAADFSLTVSPASPVSGGGSTTFQVTFNPSATGLRTALITVNSSDCDEAVYDFSIQGTGDADITPPLAICQNISVILDGSGNVGITSGQIDNGSSDICGIASMSVTPFSFTCTEIGVNTVTLTATDNSSNFSTCTATVTITDNIIPSISAPANVNVNVDAALCTASSVSLGSPVTGDNCTVLVGNDAPALFPIGTTTVTWTVTDGSGNSATATQTVSVTDNINPTISAPANVSVNVDAGICTASSVSLGSPITGDNCSVASTGSDAPSIFPIGTTTVTWTVTDASGNVAIAAQTVTVTDNVNPTISAPANVNVFANAAGCTATGINLGIPVVADNCSLSDTTNDAPSVFPIGTTTVTWTVTDGSGNTASVTQIVTVQSGLSASAMSTNVSCFGGNDGSAVINISGGTPAFTYSWAPSGGSAASASGLTAQDYTCTIIDANGCSDTQQLTIAEPPAIINSQNITICAGQSISVGANTYTSSGTYIDTLSATGGCDSALTTNLFVTAAIVNNTSASICNGDSIFLGGNSQTTAGVYSDSLITSGGCDSVVVTTLTILTVDTSVTTASNSLLANASGMTYQWVDCSNFSSISGATAQSYTPSVSGNYAVVVTDSNCSDISSCYQVTVPIGIEENSNRIVSSVHPNPFSDQTQITFSSDLRNASLIVIDVFGKEVRRVNFSAMYVLFKKENLSPGVYFYKVVSALDTVVSGKMIVE